MKKKLTEQEVKDLLNKNMFMACLSLALERGMTVKGKLKQREKQVFNRSMANLEMILKTFDYVSGTHQMHQHKVDLLMDFSEKIIKNELKIISDEQ